MSGWRYLPVDIILNIELIENIPLLSKHWLAQDSKWKYLRKWINNDNVVPPSYVRRRLWYLYKSRIIEHNDLVNQYKFNGNLLINFLSSINNTNYGFALIYKPIVEKILKEMPKQLYNLALIAYMSETWDMWTYCLKYVNVIKLEESNVEEIELKNKILLLDTLDKTDMKILKQQTRTMLEKYTAEDKLNFVQNILTIYLSHRKVNEHIQTFLIKNADAVIKYSLRGIGILYASYLQDSHVIYNWMRANKQDFKYLSDITHETVLKIWMIILHNKHFNFITEIDSMGVKVPLIYLFNCTDDKKALDYIFTTYNKQKAFTREYSKTIGNITAIDDSNTVLKRFESYENAFTKFYNQKELPYLLMEWGMLQKRTGIDTDAIWESKQILINSFLRLITNKFGIITEYNRLIENKILFAKNMKFLYIDIN